MKKSHARLKQRRQGKSLARWDRIERCILAGLDDETIARACRIKPEEAAMYRRQIDGGRRVREKAKRDDT